MEPYIYLESTEKEWQLAHRFEIVGMYTPGYMSGSTGDTAIHASSTLLATANKER